jgi:hypothetical protein
MNLTPDVATPTRAEIVVGPLPDLVQHVLRDESREDAAQALALELLEALFVRPALIRARSSTGSNGFGS